MVGYSKAEAQLPNRSTVVDTDRHRFQSIHLSLKPGLKVRGVKGTNKVRELVVPCHKPIVQDRTYNNILLVGFLSGALPRVIL